MKIMKVVGLSMGGIALLVGAIFGLQAIGLISLATFGPAQARIENNIFQQSPQYTQGMQRDIENLRLAYVNAKTQAQRQAIASTVFERFSDYPIRSLPIQDQAFYHHMRNLLNED